MTTMLDSLSAAMDRAGMSAHRAAARPSTVRGASNMAQVCAFALHRGQFCMLPDRHTGPHGTEPRTMFAVTVALSEPAGAVPLDWPETVASLLRLALSGTSVHVIDTWSPSEGTQLGSSNNREMRCDQ